MKKIKNWIRIVLIMGVVSACGSNEAKNHEHLHESHHDETQPRVNEQVILADGLVFGDERIGAIYPYYEKLSEHLVAEDVISVKKAALAIEEGAKKMNNSSLESTAAKMVSSDDLGELRRHFKFLSEELIKEIKNSGTEEGSLFIAYCPMAFDNQGAEWLTVSSTIMNPYYGESMLNCGSIKETL